MKKLINPLFVLFFVFASIGCNKSEVLTVENDKETDAYAIPILFTDSKSLSDGILVGTKKELINILNADGFSKVKSASSVNKVFVPSVIGTTNPRDPFDPTLDCWNEINTIYEQLYPEALVIANRYCREVLLCIGCPDGGLVASMIVSPTSIKCTQIAAAESLLSVFKVPGGFDGGQVTDYINQSANKR